MRVFLLSNSLAADIDESLFDEVTILPGATYQPLLDIVIFDPSKYTGSLVYLLIGPLLHSRRHKTSTRVETVLASQFACTTDTFLSYRRRLARMNCTPVVCTTFPMDFKRYNESKGRGRQIMQAFYEEYTETLKRRIEDDNKMIVAINTINKVHTPFLGKKIFPRVGSQHRYAFRTGALRDGLHPEPRVVRDWERELRRNIDLNMSRASYERRNSRKQN